MKLVIYSLILGCVFTAILNALVQIPTSGPTLLDLFVVLAFQTPTRLITKDRELGEYVYYGIQVLFFSIASYSILALIRTIRQVNKRQ